MRKNRNWEMKIMTPKTMGLLILIGCISLLGYVSVDVADAQTNRARLEAEPQLSAGGTEQCLSCHGGANMTIMADTPHGNLDNPHSPYSKQGCESCHGPGSIHVSRAGGGAGLPALLTFKGRDNVPEQNAACLACHAQTMGELEGFEWTGSLHDRPNMTCQRCHDAHSTERPMQDKEQQLANCSRCHRRHIEGHPRFEEQGILFDGLKCSTCHDVHALEARQ